jgi:hypothetical protein
MLRNYATDRNLGNNARYVIMSGRKKYYNLLKIKVLLFVDNPTPGYDKSTVIANLEKPLNHYYSVSKP